MQHGRLAVGASILSFSLRDDKDDDKIEELNVTMHERRATSRVLHLEQDWPLQLQLQKSSFPGFFKDVL